MVKRQTVDKMRLLLSGAAILVFGILLLWRPKEILGLLINIVALVMVISGTSQFIGIFTKNDRTIGKKTNIGSALFSFALGVVLLLIADVFREIPFIIFPYLVAAYTLFNGLVKIVNYLLFRKNQVKNRINDLLDCLLFLTFTVLMLFSPLFKEEIIYIIIGIYFILFGCNYIIDFIREIIPGTYKSRLKRKVRISLPVFLAAFIPQRMLSKVNDYLTEHPHAGKTLEEFEGCKSEEEPNLEVYVHVTETGGGAMGHVDVGFKGKVISYGNYDESSATWAYGKGDGVMLFTEREKYLPFCVSHSGDTIFSFGLKLSDDQIDRVHKRISEIMMETIPWDSPYDADKKAGKDAGKIQYKDYASCLAQVSDTEFYKFKRGRWKSYFVLSTNCVLLADNILSSAGTDILKMNGIVTPGVYYDYLEHEFERTDGVVITRAIFRPEKKEADAPSPPEFGKGKGKKKGR